MAIQFSTNGDNLQNTTNSTFFSASTAAQSVSVWINALWDGATKTTSMVGMYASAGGTAIQIGSRTAAGQCDIWTWGGGIMITSTGVTIPANTWVNITYTYDGTSHRLYYNGVLNNTVVNGTAPRSPQIAGNFNMVYMNGFSTGATSETGNFYVDTYDYYNRVLSADEVITIYEAEGNRHGIVYGAVLRYEFDEGIIGNTIATIINQTAYDLTVSNLASGSVRTPRVVYSPGAVSCNLRVPL
jgi:hypothetical protein